MKTKIEEIAPKCLGMKTNFASIYGMAMLGKVPKCGMSKSKLESPLDSRNRAAIAKIRDEIEQNRLRRMAKQVNKENPTARVKIVGRFLEVQKQGEKGRWQAKERI